MVPGDWSANDIGSFVAVTCGYSPGDLSAAGAASRSRLLPLFTLFFLAGALYVGVKLYYAPFMRWLPLYVLGGLFIFWFSVSGGMFNIIRGVPLVGYDPRTRNARLFMDGSGQLGAEGFIMGTHYLAFGVLVALFTRVLPTVKDNASRRAAGYTMLLLAFVLMVSVLNSHIWKTGMRSYFYF